MSEATKLSGTTLNSEADLKSEGLEARSNRTNPDVAQFTVFIAPYRLRRVLMSEANRTNPDVAQFTVFIAPCTPERQFASSRHARRILPASGGR